MKILFTGATGVIGRRAVPHLIAAGHDVAGVARSAVDHSWLDGIGACGEYSGITSGAARTVLIPITSVSDYADDHALVHDRPAWLVSAISTAHLHNEILSIGQ